jgi:hypothetical protein
MRQSTKSLPLATAESNPLFSVANTLAISNNT